MTHFTPQSNHDREPIDPSDEKARKQATLAIAVIIVTSFIVVTWIMVLPFQLQKFSVLSDEELTRWNEVRNEANQDTTFREALDGLRDSYDSLEGRYQEGSQTSDIDTGRVPPEVIDRLRSKLQELKPAEGEAADVGTVAEELEN
ncbi:MAG: hypothetical protein V1738_06360 [Patescibacteria group bacterium]